MLVGGIPGLALGLSSLLGFARTFGSWIPPEARDFVFLILIGLGMLFLTPKSKYGWFVAITVFVGFILVGSGIMGNLLGAPGAVLGGAVLSLLGLYLTYCGAHYMQIGRVRIQIYPTGVRRGDSIKCQVQIAEVRAGALERASATLFAQELVMAGYLTRPEKNTLVVYENPWPLVAASPESLGPVVTFEGLCNVPTDAPITFSSRFNNLVCGITVRLSVAHGLNWARSYQVAVYP